MQTNGLSRRKFLQLSATFAGVAALAACVPAQQGAAPAAGGAAAAKPAGEQTKLTVAHAWEAAFRPRQKEFDDKFMEKHPDIKIEVIHNTWSDHNQVVPTWAAAKTLPDLLYVHGSRSFPWAFEGIIINIQSFVDADAEFNVKGIWEEALRLYRFKGNLVSIPYDHGPIILGYNKDIFDKAGVKYPDDTWTLDTLRETAKKLTVQGDQPQWGWSGTLPGFGNGDNDNMLRPFGAAVLNDAEDTLLLDTEEAKAAVQFFTDMIIVDKSAPTPAESQAFQGTDPFTAGRVAMHLVPSWSTPSLHQFATFKWDVAGWPKGPKTRACGAFGSGYSATRDSKHPDVGWKYLREYLSKEGMEFMWGSTGRGSPARKEAYDSWMKSESAPANAKAYLDALSDYAITSRPYETLAAGQLNDITGRYATLLRNGQAKVEEALAGIMKEGAPVVKEAAARAKG